MKEIYEKPITDIEEFKIVDIITTSGDIRDDDNIVDGGDGWD